MNTNKKHKSKNKANKPPNPNQTETSEIVVESEKCLVSENVQQVCIEESKIEVTPENLDKDLEPKKPKRNKNKKKKTPDEEVIVDVLDVKPTAIAETVKESDKNVDSHQKVPVESIAPTARKKNKNKQTEEVQPTKPASTEIVPSVTKQEDQKVTQPATSPDNVKDDKNEQDTKSQKKKNKKKKRHDSERSEKADEVISCTAAFQMLLDAKTDKIDIDKCEELPKTEKQSEQKHIKTPSEPAQAAKTEDNVSKKKNKKGNDNVKSEDLPTTETQPEQKNIKIPSEPVQETKTEDHVSKKKNKKGNDNVKSEELPTVETQPEQKHIKIPSEPVQETKTEDHVSKKKNKKGNDNVKSEELPTIETQPEQKYIEISSEPEQETKTEDHVSQKKNKKGNDNVKSEELPTVETQPEEKYIEISSEPVQETKTEDHVSKKKNKKGKNKENNKQPESEVSISTLQEKPTDVIPEQNVGEKISEETVGEEIKEEEAMASPILKAKIAKPVERKQKHKPEEHIEEKEPSVSVAKVVKEEPKEIKCDKPVSLGQILFEEKKTTKEIEQIKEPKGDEKKAETTVEILGNIAEPMAKPQESKKDEHKSHSKQKKIIQQNIESTAVPIELKTTEIPKQLSINDDDDFIIPSLLDITEEDPKIVEETPIKSQLAASKNIEVKDVELPIQETNVDQPSCQTEKAESADELQVPCTRKKRRKSPKPPTKTDSVIALPDIPQQKQSEINIKSTGEEIQVKTESKQILVPTQETTTTEDKPKQKQMESEIKLKPLEVTPDLIQYPRSVSHQISDPNNNTFIQEITTPEEMKLNIPIALPETPLIKGSGETPDNPPELKTTDFTITEVKIMSTSEPPREKTDLKSKVMEVNQDMEDLRMSIERSIAELTILEKKEDETEKLYQEKGVTSEFEAAASKVIKVVDPKPNEPKVEIKAQELSEAPIVPPPRQDNKGKGKSKKKNKQDTQVATSQSSSTTQTQVTSAQATSHSTETKDDKKDNKTEQKSESSADKSKQQSDAVETQNAASETSQTDDKNNSSLYSRINKDKYVKGDTNDKETTNDSTPGEFEPIESFEDAMTSSLDDVNKSFEMIANDSVTNGDSANNPQINVTAPEEDTVKKDVKEKINPVSQPKNLLGHPDIPVPSNRTDYKKEKNRPPSTRQAKVKIKDAVDIEPKSKQSKESQTESKNKFLKKDTTVEESVTCVTNENEEYVYKYSFRKVFLPNICHICKKELKSMKVPCNYCNLIFYCSNKHKDEGWSQHQALCFAVSTVAHHKNQKHIYADSKGLLGQAYRVFRMQLIVACEKVLKRRLVPWEQEAVLYPRICANVNCREHRQDRLKDCEGCSQISYCSEDHLPKTHQKWCKSYSLYQKLVYHQQTQGRLAPKLPTRVLTQETQLPDKINMVLATLYEEKIDMNDLQYAALTQIATAPLTAAYSYQLYSKAMDTPKKEKTTFTIHIVNAELQYEADALNKWESLFLHLHPQIHDLRIVLTGTDLNPGGLPLELLGKVKLCANCRLHSRKLNFSFQDSHTYAEYWYTNEFLTPDIVCAFNPSIQRATIYNGKDQWPITINTIFKLKAPFLITSYTMNELNRDLNRIKECSKIDFKVVSKANFNPFASVRPDRNFITDDEIPLLFKNYCFAVLCGV